MHAHTMFNGIVEKKRKKKKVKWDEQKWVSKKKKRFSTHQNDWIKLKD